MDIKIIYNGVFSNPAVFNKEVHVPSFGIVYEEDPRMKILSDKLTKEDIQYLLYISGYGT